MSDEGTTALVYIEHYFPKGYDPTIEPWKSIKAFVAAKDAQHAKAIADAQRREHQLRYALEVIAKRESPREGESHWDAQAVHGGRAVQIASVALAAIDSPAEAQPAAELLNS